MRLYTVARLAVVHLLGLDATREKLNGDRLFRSSENPQTRADGFR